MYGKQAKNSYVDRTYRIKEKLGWGGSCTVYKAWHKRLRKYVTIKTAEISSAGAIAWHRNEVEALKNMKSLYLPQVVDFLICDDQSYTILEFIEGTSFDTLLKDGHIFTEKQVLKWYRQLAVALQTIHSNNVCHRDIKPANIVLTTSEDICLIDFNSALVIGNHTGVASSSMGYASPEQYAYFMQCKNRNEQQHHIHSMCDIDWKLSDIYSLGATMYHLLTGIRPPMGAEGVSHITKLKGFSKDILAIIEQSMRSVPSQRYKSADELHNALLKV